MDSVLYTTLLGKSCSVMRSQELQLEIKDKGSKGSNKEDKSILGSERGVFNDGFNVVSCGANIVPI